MTVLGDAQLTISGSRALLQRGELSVRELVTIFLERIKEKDRELGAYVEVFEERLWEEAEMQDRMIREGNTIKPLWGVPIAVKDNILIAGERASAGSRMLENYTASYDATVIQKLRSSGALFLGRTNMDEFAMGSSTEHSAFKKTKNPYDTARVPGGSSGGSAVAVAAGMAMAALGSDTGGSIRQPAAFCGAVGLKPTYGAVSRFGLIAMASSLDQIGPITRNVEDAELLFSFMQGEDPKDATSRSGVLAERKDIRIGVPEEYFSWREAGREEGLEEDVAACVRRAITLLREQGYAVKTIRLPSTEYVLPCYYVLMPAEVSANLARFDGVRYGLHKRADTLLEEYERTREQGFGREVKRRILLGAFVLSSGFYEAYYGHALKVRRAIRHDFEKAFEEVDVIISPTVPTPAFRFGEKEDPVAMYLGDIFTVPANLAGIPALSLPCGTVERDGKHLPVGVQLMAPWFGENLLFSVGRRLEELL